MLFLLIFWKKHSSILYLHYIYRYMTPEIPYKVQKLASPYFENVSGEVKYIGIYEGLEMYIFSFSEDIDTGFPILFSFNKIDDAASVVEPFEALRISNLLVKD